MATAQELEALIRNRARQRAYLRRCRVRDIDAGICAYGGCREPAEGDKQKCRYHLDKQLEHVLASNERLERDEMKLRMKPHSLPRMTA